MRCGRKRAFLFSFLPFPFGVASALSLLPSPLLPVHQQRYCMGTMIDIVAYHKSRADAERAVRSAMDEIIRLDQVMSHFKADSDLSKLVREGRVGFVTVEPSLYDVITQSIRFSELSGGKFDVTIAPVLKVWKAAQSEGRRPTEAEILEAKRCVGYEKIETEAPGRIRLRSDCLEIDLGGIGKGYAVDRAIAVLESAGIRHALINAGGSSIAAIGHPPGHTGWPVSLGASVSGSRTLLLQNASISTSQQNRTPLAFAAGVSGDILDPQTGAPSESRMTVSVAAPSATVSDALGTALIMLPIDEGMKLLEHFTNVSAMWIAPAGELKAAYRESGLHLSGAR
jgi:thiamine biosynthesis lipoprotein